MAPLGDKTLSEVNPMRSRTNLYILKLSFFSFCLVTTLASITQVSAEGNNTVSTSSSATASVTVSSACSFSRTNGSGEYNGVLANNSSADIPASTFTTFCNDPGGYAIYAIGYTNNEYGNTDLIYNNEPTSTYNIKTNPAGSSDSNWKMKLTPVQNDFAPTIENNYNNYNNIPNTYTKVASYNNVISGISVSSGNLYVENGFNNIRVNPLYLVRSGSTDGILRNASETGWYWSSTNTNGEAAGDFVFKNDNINLTAYSYKQYGASIRCLARTED